MLSSSSLIVGALVLARVSNAVLSVLITFNTLLFNPVCLNIKLHHLILF
nr:MAG TPA: hypothetical protein [Caudoviricetes sp.]